MSFSCWGFTSYLEIGSEWYGFSNANHQIVTWMNTEIVTFGNIFRSFYIIMGIARKLQSVLSLTSLTMYRSLLGYEKRVKWAWNWNLRSGHSNWGYLSFYEPHNAPHGIEPSIIHFRGINHSIIHFRNIRKPMFHLFQLKSFHYQLNHSNVIYFVSICCISSSITLTDLFFRSSWFNLPYIESFKL